MGAEDLVLNGHNVVVVEYHISDVFETSSALARQSYYNVTALPTVRFDGVIEEVGGNNTSSLYDTYLPYFEERAAILSDFSIEIDGANSELTQYVVDIVVEKVAANSSSNLALYAVLTESEIDYYWMGQEYVNYCERITLPDAQGMSLDFSSSEVLECTFSFSLEDGWLQEHCELAVWVQDKTTKEVQQAAKRHLDEFGGFPEYDAFLKTVYTPKTRCMGNTVPTIEVENLGANAIQSLDVVYQVNNQPEQSYSWTGNLEAGSFELIDLPEVDLPQFGEVSFFSRLESPNGEDDEFPANDTLSTKIQVAENVSSPVTLVLKLDDTPEQTSWELLTSAGELLYEGGGYIEPGVFVTQEFELFETDCYVFRIYDSNGDGLAGTGLFKLMYGTTVFQIGKDYGYMEEVQFGIGLTGLSDPYTHQELSVYPNPTSRLLHIQASDPCILELQDLQGKTVRGPLVNNHRISLDVTGIQNGIYLLVSKSRSSVATRKIVIR